MSKSSNSKKENFEKIFQDDPYLNDHKPEILRRYDKTIFKDLLKVN